MPSASNVDIYNFFGGSDRVLVGGVPTFSGGAFGTQLAAQAEWIEVAETFEIDTNTRYRRLYYRYASTDPWTVYDSDPETGAATAFVYSPDKLVYAGNRFESYDRNWKGGIAKLSLRAGISGTGLSAEPGGTEIAEWHATPPHNTYTDAYANTWTITGPDRQWASQT